MQYSNKAVLISTGQACTSTVIAIAYQYRQISLVAVCLTGAALATEPAFPGLQCHLSVFGHVTWCLCLPL